MYWFYNDVTFSSCTYGNTFGRRIAPIFPYNTSKDYSALDGTSVATFFLKFWNLWSKNNKDALSKSALND